jgi:AraC-like DNA-binding protein
MSSIPICRVGFLEPFVDVLVAGGIEVEKLLKGAGLPVFTDEISNGYVPYSCALDFIAEAERLRRLDSLGVRAGQHLLTTPHRLTGLRQCVDISSTLSHALESTDASATGICAQTMVWPDVVGRTVRMCRREPFDISRQGARHAEWLGLMMMVAIVRLFTSKPWCPVEIGTQSADAPGPLAAKLLPGTRFLTGQEHGFVAIPRAMLSLPATPGAAAGRSAHATAESARPQKLDDSDLSSVLRTILGSYLNDGYPRIETMARILCTSVRTLQRRLEDCGTSYSDLVAEVRFDAAMQMLARPSRIKVIDVALALGYEEPTHFARAFRRAAGISPSEYRRQLLVSRSAGEKAPETSSPIGAKWSVPAPHAA